MLNNNKGYSTLKKKFEYPLILNNYHILITAKITYFKVKI